METILEKSERVKRTVHKDTMPGQAGDPIKIHECKTQMVPSQPIPRETRPW